MGNDSSEKLYLTDDVDLMAEWNTERNEAGGISPIGLIVGSHKKVWWRCRKCRYEWISAVNKRAVSRHKCPACVGQAVHKGYNDLLSVRPDLAKEWDGDKNIFNPDEIMAGSSKKYWWKCSKCGYEWQTTVANRMKSKGCPACANQVVRKGYNDLFTVCPAIAREWDAESAIKLRQMRLYSEVPRKLGGNVQSADIAGMLLLLANSKR